MSLSFEHRLSDSPLVETIWRSQTDYSGSFISMAVSHWQMVVTRIYGRALLTIRGPESHATQAFCPPEGEWVGIFFKPGTYMPHLPNGKLVDRAFNMPDASRKSFWLHGAVWEMPRFDNADVFINRLIRDGLLAHDPVVAGALQGQEADLSPRALQYRFLRATGLTHNTIRQIERARKAASLLQQGVPILDTVFEAGYFDQPHLTRSLKHFIGQTPTQIMHGNNEAPLSVLFKSPVYR